MTKQWQDSPLVHAGGEIHWKRQARATKLLETPQGRSKPAVGRERSKAWGAVLLQALPQPFQNLAARWGFAPSDRQQSQSLHSPSMTSASVSGWEAQMSQQQHGIRPGWPSESSGHRPPQLHLCLSSSSIHGPDPKLMMLKPSYSLSGSLGGKKGRTSSMDQESSAKRSALSGGEVVCLTPKHNIDDCCDHSGMPGHPSHVSDHYGCVLSARGAAA